MSMYTKTNSESYEIYLGGKEGINGKLTPRKLIINYDRKYCCNNGWVLRALKNPTIIKKLEYWILEGES